MLHQSYYIHQTPRGASNLVQCSSKCTLEFLCTWSFSGTFIDFCFMMFTDVLMKDLARILIYVRKIFNCSASFQNTVFNVPRNCRKGTLTLNIAVIK